MSKNTSLYQDATGRWGLVEGDALRVLAKLPENSIDCIVTDPPYGIDFHDEHWDGKGIREAVPGKGQVSPGKAFERWTTLWATQCLRVLKPGGHLLVFRAPRTFARLVCGVEDAGLEVRDQLLWLNAQGLPKSRRLPGGLGTTLKPAYEPILLGRKPIDGNVAANLAAFGTGALDIDSTRAPRGDEPGGYWPANVALSHTGACVPDSCEPECPVGMIPAPHSRLFLCAKATRQEREAGCEQLPARRVQIYTGLHHPARVVRNAHPTVKPVELMRWLVRLAAPPGGVVMDAFAGSGTTGIAAVLEGRTFLGIEREPDYVDIACARLTHWAKESA